MDKKNIRLLLSSDEWRDLKLSIGTHKKKRRLTPLEVASLISKLQKSSVNDKDIAHELLLRDISIIKRFSNLVKIPDKYKEFIIWGNKKGMISFTAASFAMEGNLNYEEIEYLLDNILKYNMIKKEVRGIIELKNRSGLSLEHCINEVLKSRIKIIQKNMMIGSLKNKKIIDELNKKNPEDLNEKFKHILKEHFPTVEFFSTHISQDRFTIVTDEFGQKIIEIKSSKNNLTFDEYINKILEREWT